MMIQVHSLSTQFLMMAQNRNVGRFALFCRRCSLSNDHILRCPSTVVALLQLRQLQLTMREKTKLLLMPQTISLLLTSVRTRAASLAITEDTAAVVIVSVGKHGGKVVQTSQRHVNNCFNVRHGALYIQMFKRPR